MMRTLLLVIVAGGASVNVAEAQPDPEAKAQAEHTTHAKPGEMDRFAQEQAAKRQAQAAELARQVEAMKVAEATAKRARLDDIKRQIQAAATAELTEIEGPETSKPARLAALKAWLARYEGMEIEVGDLTAIIEVVEVPRVRAALELPEMPAKRAVKPTH
jgi:hemolysin activation/secretion protein